MEYYANGVSLVFVYERTQADYHSSKFPKKVRS